MGNLRTQNMGNPKNHGTLKLSYGKFEKKSWKSGKVIGNSKKSWKFEKAMENSKKSWEITKSHEKAKKSWNMRKSHGKSEILVQKVYPT